MSTDLKYLAFTAILTASLWIPYVVAQVTTNGPLKPQNDLDPTQRPLPLWVSVRTGPNINAVETFAPFAALVIVAHLAGKANAMTAFWAGCYFWLRLAHAAVYLLVHFPGADDHLHPRLCGDCRDFLGSGQERQPRKVFDIAGSRFARYNDACVLLTT